MRSDFQITNVSWHVIALNMLWYFLRDTVTAYPLRSVVDAEGDPSWWRSGRGVGCDVVHGETRQLTCNFKHVELGAGGDKVQRR